MFVNSKKIVTFVYVLTVCVVAALCPVAQAANSLTKTELTAIGHKIYQNETGGNSKYLIAWNNGESFASLGIGHFIWFPKGLESPFTETFPNFIAFLQQQDVPVPQWLLENNDCPWDTQDTFKKAQGSEQMKSLRQLLENTFDHQVAFIAQRMQASLALMQDSIKQENSILTARERKSKILNDRFNKLASTELGLYALIDYVNFKGEGISQSERYQNKGWGLKQVLLNMDYQQDLASTNIHLAFAQSCDAMLTRRVALSSIKGEAQKATETKWLKGWRKRCRTYKTPSL